MSFIFSLILLLFSGVILFARANSDMCQLLGAENIYSLDVLPFDCNDAFGNNFFVPCAMDYCSCNGMQFSKTDVGCVPSITANSDCTILTQCLANYTICVNIAYVAMLDMDTSACVNGSEISFFQSQSVSILTSAQLYNESELFQSCAYMVCNAGNMTGCADGLSAADICSAPEGITAPITNAPGSTPAPTNADGTFQGASKIFRLVLAFTADFDSLMVSANSKKQLLDVMTTSLTTKLHFKTIAKFFKYIASSGNTFTSNHRLANTLSTGDQLLDRSMEALAAGALTVTAEAQLAASDAASISSLLANINSLKSDKSTQWLAALANLCGCVVPLPTIEVQVVDVPAPQQQSPSQEVCSPRCIAGAIVGGVCGVILISIVVIILTRRAEQKRSVDAAQDFELEEQQSHQPVDVPNHMKV